MMTSRLLAFLPLLLLLSTPALPSPISISALPCSSIVRDLTPCLNFIRGTEPDPPSNCCNGLNTVLASIQTKSDREQVCQCVKSALSGIKYEPTKVPELSKKCHISVALPPISYKTDCKNVVYLN